MAHGKSSVVLVTLILCRSYGRSSGLLRPQGERTLTITPFPFSAAGGPGLSWGRRPQPFLDRGDGSALELGARETMTDS